MDTHSFTSSNLAEGTYDPDAQVLTIEFNNGARYEYNDVPYSVWRELCTASSAGSYFAANVRNNYSCERV